jgi:membrane protein
MKNPFTTKSLSIKAIKDILISLYEDFMAKRVLASASRLTYSTLLALVPILAVVFAIARGFGYSIYIEEWFRDLFKAQPDATEIIIGFVNSYLINTKKGVFLGIGLLFMLGTVLMLISTIEETFNDIWLVRKPRSMFRTFTDYMALLFALPIGIVAISGLSIWMQAFNRHLIDITIIGPLMKFAIELIPYVVLSAVFVGLYVFMPNTKVRVRSALLPGIAAGVSMQLFQLIYVNSQIWVSNYNAIYGSFAVIPLFMLWMQISWTIVLVGAELSYTIQNHDEFLSSNSQSELSYKTRFVLSAKIMSIICKRFAEGGQAYNSMQLKLQLGISMRVLSRLLYDLQQIHFITEIMHDDKGEEVLYQPAEALDILTIGELHSRLAQLGSDIDSDILSASEEWNSAILLYNDCIEKASKIRLKEL